MLLETAITETNCTEDLYNFQIDNSPVAFDILSTHLYSDPIMAVIRELITNAIDTKAEYTVQKPTLENPEFVVQDFGTGLSDEDIKTLYTTFFKSSKSTTNEYTGGFGLGSKAPYAYTASFIVESCYNGTKTVYLATKKDGYPVLLITETEKTDISGIKVRVPIQEKDIMEFNNKCDEYQRLLIVTPIFKYNNIGFIPLEYGSQERRHYGGKRIIYVRQGANIIDVTSFFNMDYNGYFYNILCISSIIIDVPIGTLRIAPNREALIYDNITNDFLTKVKEDLYNGIFKIVKLFDLYKRNFKDEFIGESSFRNMKRLLYQAIMSSHPSKYITIEHTYGSIILKLCNIQLDDSYHYTFVVSNKRATICRKKETIYMGVELFNNIFPVIRELRRHKLLNFTVMSLKRYNLIQEKKDSKSCVVVECIDVYHNFYCSSVSTSTKMPKVLLQDKIVTTYKPNTVRSILATFNNMFKMTKDTSEYPSYTIYCLLATNPDKSIKKTNIFDYLVNIANTYFDDNILSLHISTQGRFESVMDKIKGRTEDIVKHFRCYKICKKWYDIHKRIVHIGFSSDSLYFKKVKDKLNHLQITNTPTWFFEMFSEVGYRPGRKEIINLFTKLEKVCFTSKITPTLQSISKTN